MSLQFEGAIDNVSECQLNFIGSILHKRGYKDTKVIFEAVGQAGDNYIANVKRIIVRDDNGEFRMIAKISPLNEVIREKAEMEKVFNNEHLMYTVVLPKFQQLEEQANIPREERLRFAECYGSYTKAPYEMILLEDLTVPGFSMLDRFKPLSEQFIKSVLKNFALLHSLSFVLKYKEQETFNEYNNSLYDMWNDVGTKPGIDMLFGPIETIALMVVDGEDRKKHIRGSVLQGLLMYNKLNKQQDSKYAVILQGDTWTNNILFKSDKDSLQSVLIDYQASKVSNPTCDLMYMLFSCTDHKARLENFIDWIDYYHSELEKALTRYGLKAKYVYPRDQLDKDMKTYAKVMFSISVFQANIHVLKPEEAVKMMQIIETPVNEISEIEMNYDETTNQAFKMRLEGVVDSYVELGLI